MSVLRWRLGAASSLLACMALLGGCGRDAVKADFMEGCVQSGVSKSLCKCIFSKVESQLRAMEASQQLAPSDEVQLELVQATQVCLRE